MRGIEIKNVTKHYGEICALHNINLHFEENRIYGLLGRNGAGKSTLLNVITGRIFPDCGEVLIDGQKALENDQALQRLYMMSESNYYPESIKVSEALRWTGEFYRDFDMEAAKKLAERFGLHLNKKIRSLSTGYNTIFKLVIALSVNTPYILLDEPVLGLDANHRDLLYKMIIERYAENPCTIVLSTHIIEEVAGVIEQVVIVDDGKILRNEPTESLLSACYMATGKATAIDNFIQDRNVIGIDTLGGLKTAYITGDRSNVPEGIEIACMDLQKLFIQLTNATGGRKK